MRQVRLERAIGDSSPTRNKNERITPYWSGVTLETSSPAAYCS